MKNKLFRITKGLAQICIIIACALFIIYTLSWVAFTKRAEAYLNQAWMNKSIEITGEQPRFTGYPSVPESRFSGTIKHPSGFHLTIPDLYYSGFPLLHQLQFIEAKKGFQLSAPFLEQDLNLDYAALQIIFPYRFPMTPRKQDIEKWQKSNSPIIIPAMIFSAGHISATGQGTISLDDNLQIKADFDVHVTGMNTLLDELEGIQGKKTIAVARSFLNMMSKTDEKTGEQYFETTLKIQNRGLYFGPMRLSGLPEIKWADNHRMDEKATWPQRRAPE